MGRKKVCGESSGPCAGRRGLRQARAAAVLIAQEPLHPATHTEVSRGLSRAEVRLASVLQVQGVRVWLPALGAGAAAEKSPSTCQQDGARLHKSCVAVVVLV